MIWHCFHCSAVIALIQKNASGETAVGPTMDCARLYGIGGSVAYGCKCCGAVQVPPRRVLDRLTKPARQTICASEGHGGAESQPIPEPVPA